MTNFINRMRDLTVVLFLLTIASASLNQITLTPIGTLTTISLTALFFGFIFGGAFVFTSIREMNRET